MINFNSNNLLLCIDQYFIDVSTLEYISSWIRELHNHLEITFFTPRIDAIGTHIVRHEQQLSERNTVEIRLLDPRAAYPT